MRKCLLPLLFVFSLSGCSIIALPFKAVGAIGDIISKNDEIKDDHDIKISTLISVASLNDDTLEEQVL
ncbi:hypothetical protein MED222_11303 [Vibrio sp. MED222]|nr:hypothetical protein MED222_11303 [Vibrio sp. MED222]